MEQPCSSLSEELEGRPSSAIPFFRNHTDSPPPEPYDKLSVLDAQLINMLKQNYDIISLISDIDRPESPSPVKIATDSKNDRPSSVLFLRNRAKSVAVPSLIIGNPDSAENNVGNFNENQGKTGFIKSLRHQWSEFYADVLDAFSETNEDRETKAFPDNPNLSAYNLRRDIKRCLIECHPYLEIIAGLRDLFIWKNPIASLAVFFVYMYSVYRGWLASLFFFTILLQLILNYFAEHKEINFGLYFLPRKETSLKKLDLAGVQLVFDVARRAQILLTFIADLLEKAKALFTWKKPHVTFKFFLLITFFFVSSMMFSNSICLVFIGFMMGGKAFITTYLFHRFPKLQHMFDIIVYFYNRLPTSRDDPELHNLSLSASKRSLGNPDLLRAENKNGHEILGKSKSAFGSLTISSDARRKSIGVIPFQSTMTSSVSSDSPPMKRDEYPGKLRSLNSEDQNGEDTDELSVSDGDYNDDMFMLTRSCVIIDKERPFPRGMASGTIVLNEKMIGFRYQKVKDGFREMLQIPFSDIVSVKKIRTIKTFSLMPGTSKSLELKLTTKKKPIQFIGIPKRDEFYESLIETARIAGYELSLNDDEC